MTPFFFYIPDQLKARLHAFANEKGVTSAAVTRRAIDTFLRENTNGINSETQEPQKLEDRQIPGSSPGRR
jgi:predicted transcriptional regulator